MFELVSLKIINLAHRQDRREECLQELKKLNTEIPDFSFFSAKYIENDGARGCALSHAMALSDFLFNSENPFALILEDDFSINDADRFENLIHSVLMKSELWNTFLLGHNHAAPIDSTPIENTVRVINAQTTSGYLVSRLYAPRLIESFFRSAALIKKYEHLPTPNKQLAKHFFCADILWKELQTQDIFWASFPALIHQRKSYSDIVKKITDYGA